MSEVLAQAIRLVNLPFTLFLSLVVLYWLFVAIGLVDMHLFSGGGADLHTDAHADVHADAHADVHGDVHADAHGDIHTDAHGHFGGDKSHGDMHHGGHWWTDAVAFLNVGDVPAMIVVSVLSLCLWLGAMIGNYYFTGGSAVLSLAMVVPNFLIASVATRYLTMPLKPLFHAITRDYDEAVQIIGQHCTITTSEATPDFGRAEIKTKGSPVVLNVRTMDGAQLSRGAKAVVVREDKERGIHFITPLPSFQNPTHTS